MKVKVPQEVLLNSVEPCCRVHKQYHQVSFGEVSELTMHHVESQQKEPQKSAQRPQTFEPLGALQALNEQGDDPRYFFSFLQLLLMTREDSKTERRSLGTMFG